ncbi:MAG TPA: hypothetical protein VIJ18_18205 [Microbacteriaceae bacterium]
MTLADIAGIVRMHGLRDQTSAAGSVDADDLSTAEVIDSLGRKRTRGRVFRATASRAVVRLDGDDRPSPMHPAGPQQVGH